MLSVIHFSVMHHKGHKAYIIHTIKFQPDEISFNTKRQQVKEIRPKEGQGWKYTTNQKFVRTTKKMYLLIKTSGTHVYRLIPS